MEFLLSAKFLKVSLTSAVLFILLDFLWLAAIASAWYRQTLGYLAELDPQGKIVFNIPMGLIAQVVISLALSAVIMLALQLDNRLSVAMAWGAFIGLALYATYDFTNLSFVKGWPLWISLLDVAWGTLQGFLAGTYVYYLHRYFS
ncbi:MAG: hypothetical protein RI909_1466 [Bacteroidota bacterium]|jgi:uncharacterized membrane protein